MKINIFQGARRITYVIYFCVFVGVLLSTAQETVYVQYSSSHPNLPFEWKEKRGCDGATETIYGLPEYDDVWVTLCFPLMDFQGRALVPYVIKGDNVYGAERYSTEASQYTTARKNSFRLDEQGRAVVEREKLKNYGLAIPYAVFWTVAVALFFFVIGWIVRGFGGIRLDRDFRDDPDANRTGHDNFGFLLKRLYVLYQSRKKRSEEKDEISEPGSKKGDWLSVAGFILFLLAARFGGAIGAGVTAAAMIWMGDIIRSERTLAKKIILLIFAALGAGAVYLFAIAAWYQISPDTSPTSQ